MKVANYIANFLATVSPRAYGVVGAGAMHLNDAIAHHPGIRFLPMHHEQAASFAAEADARVSGRPGIVHVTSGPGVTNVTTGVACAWADSIPMIVIAGQVEARTLMTGAGERQRGVSEVDGLALMAPITKFAVRILDPDDAPYLLGFALEKTTTGRPGPVYIEVPLDVQNAEIAADYLADQYKPTPPAPRGFDMEVTRTLKMLRSAKRPVLVIGNGVRLAGACELALKLIDDLQIPVLTSWNASDIVPAQHPCHIGRFGLFGDRAGNFAVQNADLVFSIGCRLSIPQVGHHPELFAPHAARIVVDIDPAECAKDYLHADLAIAADARAFLTAFLADGAHHAGGRWPDWKARCLKWKFAYPLMQPEYREASGGVNAYVFMRELSAHLSDDAIVVTDVGTAFVCSQQALQLNGKQRLFHSSGIAPMGYGLPAVIGACLAGNGRPVVCIAGDGGFMFNLQELATIAHHKLPIAIFVLANGGYRTMQVTQGNHFGRESGAAAESGIKLPDFVTVAKAFGVGFGEVSSNDACSRLNIMFDRAPCVCQVNLAPDQQIAPRVQSRMENGAFVPVRLEDMWPHLPKAELWSNAEFAS